jgi:hypothetical protein
VYARQWPSTPGYWTVIRPSLKKEIALPRQVRDSSLETRTARSRLKTRHKPYFRLIEPGLHIGYRKLSSGPGTWVVRRYRGRGAYTVEIGASSRGSTRTRCWCCGDELRAGAECDAGDAGEAGASHRIVHGG